MRARIATVGLGLLLVSRALVWGPWWFPFPGRGVAYPSFLAEVRHLGDQIPELEARLAELDPSEPIDAMQAAIVDQHMAKYRWAVTKLVASLLAGGLCILIPVISILRGRRARAEAPTR